MTRKPEPRKMRSQRKKKRTFKNNVERLKEKHKIQASGA